MKLGLKSASAAITMIAMMATITVLVLSGGCDSIQAMGTIGIGPEGDANVVTSSDTGRSCNAPADCASGYCDVVGRGADGALRRACTNACTGDVECLTGWSCASPSAGAQSFCQCQAQAELCDGADNDCDGVIDGQAADASCAEREGKGKVCRNGVCACATTCGGACVDTSSDPENCGSCGTSCGPNGGCTNGKCGCSIPGEVACNGACVAVATSPDHCGACGKACGTNEGCLDGQCLCTKSTCSGACVDTKTDKNHCGTCGTVCANDCVDGACQFGPVASIATAMNTPTSLVVTAAGVFWIELGFPTWTLKSCPITGCAGSPPVLATSTSASMTSLAVGTNSVFWRSGTDKVMACTLPNCTPTAIVTMPQVHDVTVVGDVAYIAAPSGIHTCAASGCNNSPTLLVGPSVIVTPKRLAATATDIYVVSGDHDPDSGFSELVVSCPTAGCSPAGAKLIWTNPDTFAIEQFAAAGDKVGWVNPIGSLLFEAIRKPRTCGSNGCPPGAIGTFPGYANPGRMALNASSVVFVGSDLGGGENDPAKVGLCTSSGCGQWELAYLHTKSIAALALHEDYLYWATGTANGPIQRRRLVK